MLKKYSIYQIKDIEKVDYAFRDYDEKKFNFDDDYEEVYSGYIDEEDGLEYIFYKFNCEHPEDFEGHSLSVSDIVKFGDDYFYCQSLGWKNVSYDCEIPLF